MRPVIPEPGSRRLARVLPCLLLLAGLGAACEPTVKIEAPREPITINLNIKIEADAPGRLRFRSERAAHALAGAGETAD